MLVRRLLTVVMVAGAVLPSVAAPAAAQVPEQCHTVPFYVLIPHNTCPLSAPRCWSDYGVCRYPPLLPRPGREGLVPSRGMPLDYYYYEVKGGMQCQCQAPNGAAVPGVIR